ncbi:MAG: hypothetical protein JNJ60_08800 [Rhodocyclaceae bacterium]|nr:hypothetical protein [Rhodocyclaceae bacterium]
MADELAGLLDRVENDPGVDAVVFTGTRPGRFIGHADVGWLQEHAASCTRTKLRGATYFALPKILPPLMCLPDSRWPSNWQS